MQTVFCNRCRHDRAMYAAISDLAQSDEGFASRYTEIRRVEGYNRCHRRRAQRDWLPQIRHREKPKAITTCKHTFSQPHGASRRRRRRPPPRPSPSHGRCFSRLSWFISTSPLGRTGGCLFSRVPYDSYSPSAARHSASSNTVDIDRSTCNSVPVVMQACSSASFRRSFRSTRRCIDSPIPC